MRGCNVAIEEATQMMVVYVIRNFKIQKMTKYLDHIMLYVS